MSYAYTNGDGVAALVVTEPDGATEPLSNLDNAIRQIKAYLLDPIEGPDAKVAALASPIRVIATHSGSPVQLVDESDGQVTVQFDTIDLDSGGDYNNATFLFTAPEDGFYIVICQVTVEKNASAAPTAIVHQLDVMVNGVSGARVRKDLDALDTPPVDLLVARCFNLSAGQTLQGRYTLTVGSGTMEVSIKADPRATVFQVTRFALS